MQIEPGTIRYEVEKLRMYVVRVLLDEVRGGAMDRATVAAVAKDVLALTDEIKKDDQITGVLDQLVAKYPALEAVRIKHLAEEDAIFRSKAATQITELLHKGDLDGANLLAQQLSGEGAK